MLLQLVEVCHSQLISLEVAELEGAWQKPHLAFYMYAFVKGVQYKMQKDSVKP